mmetsp:Transcript_24742/g.49225  ORF Transcript_24742/g.49225 Transcript_24742/m.49225 type:complete len:168 (+) Transcript_24742:114-617(+)|eukprot:CAMPEP_0194304026 /NCGR_PEP_ID=MMETSP0171-20130528/1823_1 /TAXON_ID=218684 /ORGANISM="Corethron pennatum, Strain L29A3" /LENGTH=167 /DNA_ID=CAMNT_0039055133 /DNA_START=67 /DNA_END=567 /DNA_ORIENTATION=+
MTKMKNIFFPVLTFVASVPASTDAFFIIPQHTVSASTATTSVLHFGLPNFGPKESSSDELTPKKGKKSRKKNATAEEPLPEAKIGLGSLIQLITAGMGSPFLGDFEGVEEGTGKLMFSLEANNLVDEDGKSKQTKMPYFEDGWVDEKDAAKEKQRKASGGGGFKLPW